jgi:N-acetylmuramoyl-L-alanine amidase
LQLGSTVLGSLAGITTLHQKRVEQAGFAVLKSPDVPSILVETGFISNARDSQRLVRP